jgi:hypothetical protein
MICVSDMYEQILTYHILNSHITHMRILYGTPIKAKFQMFLIVLHTVSHQVFILLQEYSTAVKGCILF